MCFIWRLIEIDGSGPSNQLSLPPYIIQISKVESCMLKKLFAEIECIRDHLSHSQQILHIL